MAGRSRVAIRRRSPAPRHAAAIIVLVVFKVFLSDATTAILYRFALRSRPRLTLPVLGYLYQRMLKRVES
jgi:hypothetical protein